MTITLIVPDEPTADFGAVFTRNAFPGAPVKIGRCRLQADKLAAIVVNNKISNVCAEGGVEASEKICDAVADALSLEGGGAAVFPSSTGIIGFRLPVDEIIATVPSAVESLQADSIMPAAEGIMTTDLYAKAYSKNLSNGGRICGTCKGAGMIEPNMATMLGFILTDVAVPRDTLRDMLAEAVGSTFNSMSVDSDQSTSDTVAILSSGKVSFTSADEEEFRAELKEVCAVLAEGVVRNGEGCNHLIRVQVNGAPSALVAKGVGKAVVNSPLFKCAVAGNDPNVGRLASAVGDYIGSEVSLGGISLDNCVITMGNETSGKIVVFSDGAFRLGAENETLLSAHMAAAEQVQLVDGNVVYPDYPPHDRAVEITIDMGVGEHSACVLGSDLTHEYVTINGDYRS
jgi:glutamate N-acetyltransferase/amino-acid N-acetyltransferase